MPHHKITKLLANNHNESEFDIEKRTVYI